MPVLGIGGLFFRARDPDALAAWYRTHLGVGADPANGVWTWETTAGPVVFSPFAQDTDYLPRDKAWMLNLRVTGLDELVDTLAKAGIAAERRAEWDSPEAGRFARILDPEGNAIELWEPAA